MRFSRFLLALAVVSLLVHASPVVAQGRQGGPPPAAAGAKAGMEADLLPAEPVVSQHTGTFSGQTVAYTAEVGWIPIRDEGKVVAKMGYIAYTKNGVTDVSTRPLDLHRFHGKLADIQSVGDFIYAFINRKGRWPSPKFIIGESYGTTRASGLVASVQSRFQMWINGVILVSATGLDVERGPEVSFATSLPTQTATAWYHQQLAPDLQAKPLRDTLAEAETFAMGEYLAALVRGDQLTDAERDAIATKVARYSGLDKDYVLQANLRVSFPRHWKELLRDQRMTVGGLDTRYLGIDIDAAGERPEYSPELADWNGPFGAAINRYLRTELKYNPEIQYYIWGNVRPWAQDPVSVGDMLRTVMRDNPYLKVLVQGGYYDAATDYFNAKYTMHHLQPGGEFKDRYRFAWYESGHMRRDRRCATALWRGDPWRNRCIDCRRRSAGCRRSGVGKGWP